MSYDVIFARRQGIAEYVDDHWCVRCSERGTRTGSEPHPARAVCARECEPGLLDRDRAPALLVPPAIAVSMLESQRDETSCRKQQFRRLRSGVRVRHGGACDERTAATVRLHDHSRVIRDWTVTASGAGRSASFWRVCFRACERDDHRRYEARRQPHHLAIQERRARLAGFDFASALRVLRSQASAASHALRFPP